MSWKCKRVGKQSCIKVANVQSFVSGFQQDYHIMGLHSSAIELQINSEVQAFCKHSCQADMKLIAIS
nr:hypothetical protein CFP56_53834 [Quercus suber]